MKQRRLPWLAGNLWSVVGNTEPDFAISWREPGRHCYQTSTAETVHAAVVMINRVMIWDSSDTDCWFFEIRDDLIVLQNGGGLKIFYRTQFWGASVFERQGKKKALVLFTVV